MWFLCADNMIRPFDEGDVLHLPDCTGWSWREAPNGYRILGDEEVIRAGDKFLAVGATHDMSDITNSIGKTVLQFRGNSQSVCFRAKEPVQSPADDSKAKSDVVGVGLMLIPWYSILSIGKIFIEGLRYGRDNWKKGVGDKTYQEERLEHAMLHLIKYKERDRTEDHLAKVAWFCVTQIELERLEKEQRN